MKFIFQAEDTTDNPHYQVFCKRKAKEYPKKWAKSLNEDFSGIEIRPCSTAGKDALADYCMKKDSRVAGPWADKPIYMGQDLPAVLRSWQSDLREEIKGAPDNRKIIWYTDLKGSTGKSTLSKYLYFHDKVLTMTFADAKDLLNLVYKMQGLPCYIFDLSRTKGAKTSMSDIYQALESIKNGYFINAKYETGVACYAIPHVVVFSNAAPDLSKLSFDRWDIRNL